MLCTFQVCDLVELGDRIPYWKELWRSPLHPLRTSLKGFLLPQSPTKNWGNVFLHLHAASQLQPNLLRECKSSPVPSYIQPLSKQKEAPTSLHFSRPVAPHLSALPAMVRFSGLIQPVHSHDPQSSPTLVPRNMLDTHAYQYMCVRNTVSKVVFLRLSEITYQLSHSLHALFWQRWLLPPIPTCPFPPLVLSSLNVSWTLSLPAKGHISLRALQLSVTTWLHCWPDGLSACTSPYTYLERELQEWTDPWPFCSLRTVLGCMCKA